MTALVASLALSAWADCRQHYDVATGKIYYGCDAPQITPSRDPDVEKVVAWVQDIEAKEGIRLPSYSPQPPFVSRESALAAADYLFYAITSWASGLGKSTDQANSYLATALQYGALT
ncbi:MAG TPA: hypothetical protein VM782_13260, partial [Stellaceae bacterium]|nr:hypothetical protein [Stellaceae bacterium]